jgi:ESCRT-I complex subunit VPS28
MATISLDEEARLYQTNSEREKYESLATLYGIIVTLEYLERAYVRDAINATQCETTFHLSDRHLPRSDTMT